MRKISQCWINSRQNETTWIKVIESKQMQWRQLSAKELFWSPHQLCYTPSTLSKQVKFQDIKNIVTQKQERKMRKKTDWKVWWMICKMILMQIAWPRPCSRHSRNQLSVNSCWVASWSSNPARYKRVPYVFLIGCYIYYYTSRFT